MMNKHEKIYELTGIEQLWWNDDEKLTPNKFVQEELLNTRWFKEAAKPHYPCEQLWDMLPEVIETYYSFGINKKGLGYLHDINSEDVLHWVSFKNLQEALLDMVLLAIEQNHIKKVSE